uniref:uncharacterized protein isoform X2 n=1 Tax=Pristiophorus japonicus TaxID=55135 RepID=UPI00398E406F
MMTDNVEHQNLGTPVTTMAKGPNRGEDPTSSRIMRMDTGNYRLNETIFLIYPSGVTFHTHSTGPGNYRVDEPNFLMSPWHALFINKSRGTEHQNLGTPVTTMAKGPNRGEDPTSSRIMRMDTGNYRLNETIFLIYPSGVTFHTHSTGPGNYRVDEPNFLMSPWHALFINKSRGTEHQNLGTPVTTMAKGLNRREDPTSSRIMRMDTGNYRLNETIFLIYPSGVIFHTHSTGPGNYRVDEPNFLMSPWHALFINKSRGTVETEDTACA